MNNVAQIALAYLHEKEVPGNMGFEDKIFQKKMEEVGFHKGYAWCALFGELCVKEGAPGFYNENEKLFSASAVATYNNFKAAGLTTDKPEIGYLACWKHGKGSTGHLAVVVGNKGTNLFQSVEGNSNENGSREGFEVAYKADRQINKPFSAKGLNLLGFVKII